MILKFRTNLKCNGCIQTVKPTLDNINAVASWSVDLNSPDRILLVEGDNLDELKIVDELKAAGYFAEKIG
jgi:copper chaperone